MLFFPPWWWSPKFVLSPGWYERLANNWGNDICPLGHRCFSLHRDWIDWLDWNISYAEYFLICGCLIGEVSQWMLQTAIPKLYSIEPISWATTVLYWEHPTKSCWTRCHTHNPNNASTTHMQSSHCHAQENRHHLDCKWCVHQLDVRNDENHDPSKYGQLMTTTWNKLELAHDSSVESSSEVVNLYTV